MRKWYVTFWMAVLAVGLSYGFGPAPPSYASLDARGNPLRTAFNDDLGKVRVLMLVAPS